MKSRFAGCDLGSATASFAIIRVEKLGGLVIEEVENIVHNKKPMEVFTKWYNEKNIASCAGLAATGFYVDELTEPVIIAPEDSCLESAIQLHDEMDSQFNVISIGATGYRILTRKRVDDPDSAFGSDPVHHCQYLENQKCSSGAGENMLKMAGRFGFSISEIDEMALSAKESIPITARCSVFAKSEMTHFANQGASTGDLFRGFFDSVARNVAGLMAREQVDGDIFIIGGGSRIESLVDTFKEILGSRVHVPFHALCFEALGAAVIASERRRPGDAPPLPENPDDIVRPVQKHIQALKPARVYRDNVAILPAEPFGEGASGEPAILGLDLGSTGSKAVLTSVKTGEPVYLLYDQTRGNPVDAARRLIQSILSNIQPDIRAIGVTGSGREAVATLVRAVFSENADRVVILNEIVAHATAAIRRDDQKGKDLSIVEIGGQDAKYIRVQGGRIVESDMNKACSAGTGSFLEEQANFYGVADIRQFIEMAMKADNPPDLGQMCTVFVAEAGSLALNEGFTLEDIFAGFQYSVIHNYINRVMGQRTPGETIFFQGKPAGNPSLAWTLAGVTGKKIVVPPNPGEMGAWGIGLCVLDQVEERRLVEASPLDIGEVLETEIVARTEFRCKDPKCRTLCPIQKTVVAVGDEKKTILSGGVCPKYEISSAASPKLDKDAPDPFLARRKLMDRLVVKDPGKPTIAIPLTISLYNIMPWLVTFIQELGCTVEILKSNARSLGEGERMCYVFDSCGPSKIAYGICDSDAPVLFFPKVIFLNDDEGLSGQTCVMEQGLPDLVEKVLDARNKNITILKPALSFKKGWMSKEVVDRLLPLAGELNASPAMIRVAAGKAAAAQVKFHRDLLDIGAEAMAYARLRNHPIILVCGPLHVIHEPSMNIDISNLFRKNGSMAVPMDCFSIDPSIHPMDEIHWACSNRSVRAAAAAAVAGDVFPLLLSSFGCTPTSFTEPVFSFFLEGHPHTILESDGHVGAAGYITRIQAFLHTVDQYRKEKPGPIRRDGRDLKSFVNRFFRKVDPVNKETRYIFLPWPGRLPGILAGAYRSLGFDVAAPEMNNPDIFAIGKRDCSGKECLPYMYMWGAFKKHLMDHPPRKKTAFMQLVGESPCRNAVFSLKDKVSIAKMGLSDRVASGGIDPYVTPLMGVKVILSVVSWDILHNLAAYHYAVESRPGEVDALYEEYCDKVGRALRKESAGPVAFLRILRQWRELRRIFENASSDFLELERRASPNGESRTVLVSGELYVRLDDKCNDDIVRRLARYGLRMTVEPNILALEYLAHIKSRDGFNIPDDPVNNTVVKNAIRILRRDLFSLVRKKHPWLPMPDILACLDKSRPHIDVHPKGEAPITIGSVLHLWDEGRCDGVVLPSPWGCQPSLVSEGVLRHRKEIPTMYIYSDGSAIDERRIRGFAYRLKENAPRRAA